MSDKHRSVAVIIAVHAFEKETELDKIMAVLGQYTGAAQAILLQEGARGIVEAKSLAVKSNIVLDDDTLGEVTFVCMSAAMAATLKALQDKYGWDNHQVKAEQAFMLAALDTGEETH